MLALAREVRQRGHEVFFLGVLDAQAMVAAAGIDFVPLCPEAVPLGETPRRIRELSRLSGGAALKYTIQLSMDATRTVLAEGAQALQAAGPDALVLDTVGSGLNLVAMHLQIPFIHVSNAMHFDFSGATPLCFFDFPYRANFLARMRNLQAVAGLLPTLNPLIDLQRAYARSVGLTLDFKKPSAALSTIAQLTQTPREFDFPGTPWPPHFHYTGPFHDEALRPRIEFPWERLTGEPLLYISMGTLQNGSEQVFRTLLEGAAAPGRQLVLSVGTNLDLEELGPTPANTIVARQVPQLEILKRAALCITHAGLNTVLESLAHGVPMVAVPITNDQPGVGARIAYTGTGVVVSLAKLSAARVRAAVETVLDDPSYRQQAERLQRAIRETKGLELTADIIDRELRRHVR